MGTAPKKVSGFSHSDPLKSLPQPESPGQARVAAARKMARRVYYRLKDEMPSHRYRCCGVYQTLPRTRAAILAKKAARLYVLAGSTDQPTGGRNEATERCIMG